MAGLKPRAGSYLELDLPGRKNSLEINPSAVLSPITELAKNLESSLGRTPKRKLSLSGSDALTPCSTSTLSRSLSTVSNESGYCPGSPPGPCFDSPSLEVLKSNAEKRALRRHAFKRWNSLPVKTGEDPLSANKENIEFDLELEKENDDGTTTNCGSEKRDFKFAQPKCPVVRRLSKSSTRRFPSRTLSDPSPQPLDLGSSIPSSPSYSDSQDSGLCEFDQDAGGDDDGFIDDLVQEQGCQDHSSQVPDGMAQLLSAPLVSRQDPVEDGRETSTGQTPKASGPSYTPRDLFNAGRDRAYTVASGSPTRERLTTRSQSKSFAIKRPNPRRDPSPNLKKRLRQRCMSLVEGNSNPALLDVGVLQSRDVKPCPIRRSHSATFEHDLGNLIDTAGHANVVGDFSRPYTLPSIAGQHEDLKCLTPETVARVLDNQFPDVEAHIIDCRYPYEYNAGHIRGADNIYTRDEMFSRFIENPKKSSSGKTTILIFHCEFSSKRGPDMSRFLRNRDRDVHYDCYPTLYYPELYLIEGGYKAFFAKCKEYCEPQCYLPMVDENYAQDLKRFSRRSKSDGNILAKGFRPGLGYNC